MTEPYSPASRNFQGQQAEPWHLKKEVSIGTILTLITNLCVMVWMFSQFSSSISEHDRRLSAIELRQDGTQQQLQKLNESVARMDERLGLQIELLKEIKVNVGGRR